MIGEYMGKEGKLSFLFLLMMIGILIPTQVYADEITIEYKFVDVEDGTELNKLTETIEEGELVEYVPSETISVDGTDYTKVELEEISETVTEDTEYIFEYSGSPATPKPEGIVQAEDSTDGMLDINNILWRLKDGNISTEVDVEISGKHMATRLGTISQTVGSDNELIEDESDSMKTETSMKKASNFKDDFSDSNSFNRDTDGVYRLKVSYWYTNLAEANYNCEIGTEERCFSWELDEDEPYTPYWGSYSEEVEVDGEVMRSTNIYELEVELSIDDVSNKDYTLSELPDELPIGKGISEKTEINTGVVDDNSGLVERFYERFNIQQPEEFKLPTNKSVSVREFVGYENDFNEELVVNGSPKYYIGNIDKNLQDKLDESDYGYGVDLIYNSDNQSFELGKTFGLTQKYGIQFLTDRREYVNNKVDLVELEKSKDEELKRLNLGEDKYENLDYRKSRYFLPIDDKEYLNEDEPKQYKDVVVLDGIGLNNLSLRYDKLFTVEQPLFSDESDSIFKGYMFEVDDNDSVEYTDSEILTEEIMQQYLGAYDTSEKVNLFRSTNDFTLKEHLGDID